MKEAAMKERPRRVFASDMRVGAQGYHPGLGAFVELHRNRGGKLEWLELPAVELRPASAYPTIDDDLDE